MNAQAPGSDAQSRGRERRRFGAALVPTRRSTCAAAPRVLCQVVRASLRHRRLTALCNSSFAPASPPPSLPPSLARYGYAMRVVEAMLAGCMPLIVQVHGMLRC